MATSSGYSSSISTFPIRAPLTLDSDSESCLSSEGHKYDNINVISNTGSYGSDISGFESEGFLSGEDEVDTGSERAFVADLNDDDLAENDDFASKDFIFRPFISDPNGKSNKYDVSRAYVASTSREGTSLTPIKGTNCVDFGAYIDEASVQNDNFGVILKPSVNITYDEIIENTVSRAYVSIANRERTSVKSIAGDKYGHFSKDPNDNLISNGDFIENHVYRRPFANDQCGENNQNGVSNSYVPSTSREGTRMKSKEDDESRDFGSDPCDALNENDNFADDSVVIRPIVNNPFGKINETGVSRAYVAKIDEKETSVKPIEGGEYGDLGESSNVNIGILAIQKPVIPIAKLSRDSDDESLTFEDEENDEFLCDTRVKVPIDDEFVPELDEVFGKSKMSASVIENTELQGGEIVASDFVYDKNDSINGSEGSKLVEIDSASFVKKNNLGAEIEDGPHRSYDVYDPLLMSTLGIEFTESKDKQGYDEGDSEKSFSIDDYSNGSIIDDTVQTSSLSALDRSSDDDVDTSDESKEEEFLDLKKLNEEKRKTIEERQLIRAKFSKLVQRLGISVEDPITANQLFTFESAMNTNLEFKCENGKADYDLSLNILVIGKTGVGKSATINSLFDEEKASVSAFEPATTCVREIIGTIDDIKVRVYDTPGLRPSPKEQSFNSRVFSSIKRLMKKSPPDIVLYVDRLDIEREDLNDMEFLRSITKFLGSSIWEKAIILLTHAGSSPPDGPNGSPLSYDLYVAQRLSTIQFLINRSLGYSRLDLSSNSSFSLVENVEKSFFNREKWRLKLLLLCSSMKILSGENLVVKNQGLLGHRKVNQRSENLPVVTWRGGIGWSGNLQLEFPLRKGSKMVFRARLDDKLNERVSVRISSFEQLQLMLLGVFSIVNAIVR